MRGSSKWIVAMFAAALAANAAVHAQEPATPPGGSAPPSSEARVQEAVDATGAVKGTKGAERESALERAARMWEGVLTDFGSGDRSLGARAGWEAGELWRRRGDLAEADRCYARALELDDGRYKERATFARADVARRQERFDEAIAFYREVTAMRPDSARAHDARLRAGRCLESKGEADAAIQTYREALDVTATEPRRAVDAANFLARALVGAGDLDGAQAAIDRAESIAKPLLDAGGDDATRLRKALDSMSARRALQRARDDHEDAGRDAERLDEDDRSGG